MPVAVVDGQTDEVFLIRTDHIGRPVFAADDNGLKVWEATYLPFGGVHVASTDAINLRFPGQWFHAENGLHQNWMRDYDPTTGRYMQADPLGLVDGASVYGYALQNPGRYTDPRGEFIPGAVGGAIAGGVAAYITSDGCWAAVLAGSVAGGGVGALSLHPTLGGAGAAALGQIIGNELSCYCEKPGVALEELVTSQEFWLVTGGGAFGTSFVGAGVNNAKHLGITGTTNLLGPRLTGGLKEGVIGVGGGLGEYLGSLWTE